MARCCSPVRATWGAALLAGWLDRGLDPSAVQIQDPSPPRRREPLLERYHLAASPMLETQPKAPAVIVVAVNAAGHGRGFSRAGAPRRAAHGRLVDCGRTHARGLRSGISRRAPPWCAPCRITPAAIARGISVAVPNAHVTAAQRQLCDALLRAVGEVEWVAEEGCSIRLPPCRARVPPTSST